MMMMKSALSLMAAAAGLSGPALADPARFPAPAFSHVAMSSLGDLTPYRTIAIDTLKIVDAGDLPAARHRIKDLETAWDEAEAAMKPKDRTTWTSIDKSIDAALSALRADAPRQTECATTLKALVAKIDGAGKA